MGVFFKGGPCSGPLCVAWALTTLPLLGHISSLGSSNAVPQPSTPPTSIFNSSLVSFLDLIAQAPWVLFRASYTSHIPLVDLSSGGFPAVLLPTPTSFQVLRMDEELVSHAVFFRLSIMQKLCSNFPSEFLTAAWSPAKHPVQPNQTVPLEGMCGLAIPPQIGSVLLSI